MQSIWVDAIEPPLLALERVKRTYTIGDQTAVALNGINLSIFAGEFVAIVGPSGSGKSTLLNILGCLDKPTEGHYRVAGQDIGTIEVDALAALRRHTFGFVFQAYNLLTVLTARENVELPAVYAGEAGASRRARAIALLTRLGLADFLDHRPPQLSGGQQQRVGIARAMINGSTIILADEPTGALDSCTSEQMLCLFRGLCDDGYTVLIVTHDQHVASQADRILEIADGCICSDRVVSTRPRGDFEAQQHPARATAWFSRGREALCSAMRTMAAHRLRNTLTMLGIIAGIASVILSFAIGEGSQEQILQQIKRLGANITLVQAGTPGFWRRGGRPPETLKAAEIERLGAMPFLIGASSTKQQLLTIRYRSREAKATVYGVSDTFFKIEGMPLIEGRPFTAKEAAASELDVVIDPQVQKRLFEESQSPLGAIVFLGDLPARVIGVAAPRPTSQYGANLFAAIPSRTFDQRLSRSSFLLSAEFGIADRYDRDVAISAVRRLLHAWHNADDFQIIDFEEIRQAHLRAKAILSLLTGSIACIALLVAGIGVVNMMLVSVVERTREIGILMAIGARRGDIMFQFFAEAVLLCVSGGIFGMLLAFAASKVIVSTGIPIALDFNWHAVVGAFVISSLAGLVAGVVPARRAAHIEPVEALAR